MTEKFLNNWIVWSKGNIRIVGTKKHIGGGRMQGSSVLYSIERRGRDDMGVERWNRIYLGGSKITPSAAMIMAKTLITIANDIVAAIKEPTEEIEIVMDEEPRLLPLLEDF